MNHQLIYQLIKTKMSKEELVKCEAEKMYQVFKDRDCQDLLAILIGRIQLAFLENQD